MTRPQTSPQERSNLARKAAHARWSRTGGGGDLNGSLDPKVLPSPPSETRKKKRKPRYSWIENRFCLQLHQDSAGTWLLKTPSGLELPASNSEISLWLDIESLRFQLSEYHAIND